MADFIQEKRKEIDARIKELRPLVGELERLEQARSALDATGSGPGRPRGSRSKSSNGRRRRGGGRPRKGQPTRADQLVKVVAKHPEGIKIADAAKEMGIKQANYLYRLSAGLEKDGKLKKRGGKLVPASRSS